MPKIEDRFVSGCYARRESEAQMTLDELLTAFSLQADTEIADMSENRRWEGEQWEKEWVAARICVCYSGSACWGPGAFTVGISPQGPTPPPPCPPTPGWPPLERSC